jgi:hypothetical protein
MKLNEIGRVQFLLLPWNFQTLPICIDLNPASVSERTLQNLSHTTPHQTQPRGESNPPTRERGGKGSGHGVHGWAADGDHGGRHGRRHRRGRRRRVPPHPHQEAQG